MNYTYRYFLQKYDFITQPVELLLTNEKEGDTFDVSLAIPSYKRTDLFIRLLNCIEAQDTNLRFEVVITEDTREEEHIAKIIAHLKKCSFKYRYYRNIERQGLYPNWNQSISLCKGTYFSLVHTDDVLRKDWLKAYEKFLPSQPEAIGQKWNYIYANKNIGLIDEFLNAEKSLPHDTIERGPLDFLWGQLVVPLLGCLIRKDQLNKVGYFPVNEEWSNAEDLFFMCKLSLACKIKQIDFSGYGYVIEENIMMTCDGWNKSIIEVFQLRCQMLTALNLINGKQILKAQIKVLFETHDRIVWNRKNTENKEKIDKSGIYRLCSIPLSLRMLLPLLFVIRKIRRIVLHK